jgi:hypothetical protein
MFSVVTDKFEEMKANKEEEKVKEEEVTSHVQK